MKMDSKLQFKNGLITFDESTQEWILSAFGISVDKGGYLVETDHPEMRVITPNGEEILIEEFAGIRKSKTGTGIEIIKNDLPSLIDVVDSVTEGTWEPSLALQCSNCNGIVTTELNDLEHCEDEDDGEMTFECPHCGSWNKIG